jgi:hypothetical protein
VGFAHAASTHVRVAEPRDLRYRERVDTPRKTGLPLGLATARVRSLLNLRVPYRREQRSALARLRPSLRAKHRIAFSPTSATTAGTADRLPGPGRAWRARCASGGEGVVAKPRTAGQFWSAPGIAGRISEWNATTPASARAVRPPRRPRPLISATSMQWGEERCCEPTAEHDR